MLESVGHSQDTAGWDTFTTRIEYNSKREGTHFGEGDPEDTTKERASCSVKSDKLWCVRKHSCPAGSRWIEIRALQSTFYRVGLKSEDWDAPKGCPQNRPAILMCERELRSRSRLLRLGSVCSHRRVLPMLWMESVFARLRLAGCQTRLTPSSKQEAPLSRSL